MLFLRILCLLSFAGTTLHAQTNLKKLFSHTDTVSNHRTAVNKLTLEFNKAKNLSPEDSLNFEKRLAHRYLYLQKLDSTLSYVNEGLLHAELLGQDSTTAYLLKLKGNAFYYLGQKEQAVKAFESSLKIARENNLKEHLANVLSNLGVIHLEKKAYPEAVSYLSESIALFKSLNQSESTGSLLAQRILGNYFYENEDYNQALQIFTELTAISKSKGLRDIQSSAQTFKALSLNKLGRIREAEIEFNEVLALQKDLNILDTEAAVLSHYLKFLKDRKRYPEAVAVYEKIEQIKTQIFKDQLSKGVSEAETKYNTQLAIQDKKIAELLVEQKNQELISSKKTQEKQYLVIGFLVIVLMLFTLIVLFFINYKKMKTKQQLEEARINFILLGEEKERTRIAKDLHDGIVQDLVAIKNKLKYDMHTDSNPSNTLESIYTELDKTSKEVREISYQMMPLTLKEFGLEKALDTLLNRTLSAHQITFDFNTVGIEQRLPEKIEVSVYRICQELLNNSLKHSKASHISLLLMSKNNTLSVTYEDNGIGFDAKNIEKGIGLNSLKSRIEMIKGNLEFDSEINKGTTAYIKIPL
jgi:signal transduction histidine kinase